MRPQPCSVALSITGGSLLAWLISTWMHTTTPTPFVAPPAICVRPDRGVLRAWSCQPEEAEVAMHTIIEQNRLRAALGSRLCWWNMTQSDLETLPGVGPATALRLLALAATNRSPSLFELHRIPRIGPATALRILAMVTTECRTR